MRHLPMFPKAPARTLALLLLASCGGSEPTAPPTPPPPVAGSLTLVSGDAQTGVAGAALGAPLVVNVKSTDGAAMSGQAVAWAVAGGGGAVSQATTNTGADGNASVTWTLGGAVGAQSVTATTASFSVTFTAQAAAGPVAQVSVTPAEGSLDALDATVQLEVALTDRFGNPAEGSVTWASTDTAVVVVDTAGSAKAVGNGTAQVVATAEGASGSTTLTVAQKVFSVAATPSNASVKAGETTQLTAAAKDANGFLVKDAGFAWSSSDTAVAAVDSTGLVSGVAEGSAVVRVASGDATDSVAVTVTPDAFRPQEDLEISDSLNVAELEIPAGVTVTLKEGAAINATGNVTIEGTLSGDCVPAEIVVGGNLSVTGTVSNVCASAPDGGPPALVLRATGDTLRLVGATLTSSGNVVIGDTAGVGVNAVATARAEGDVNPTSGVCFFLESTIGAGTNTPGTEVFLNEPGDVFLFCRGKMVVSGATVRAGDGTAGADAEGAESARGGEGGTGGSISFTSLDEIEFNTSAGRSQIHLGNGGRGGHANAVGEAPRADGGPGGSGGRLTRVARSTVGFPDAVDLHGGDGGRGGDATAVAADGVDAAAAPAQPGGRARAFGGAGGEGSSIVLDGDVPPLAQGRNGDGGNARARSGSGGDGNATHPQGADGGEAYASGGRTGARTDDELEGDPGALGRGGDAIFEGGAGGASFSQCVGLGLAGGAGGKAGGGGGVGGPAGRSIFRGFGNGGSGGSGTLPGPGGSAGSRSVFGVEVFESDPNFSQGPHGGTCPQDVTLATTVGVASDPEGHEPFVNMGSVTQTRAQFAGSGAAAPGVSTIPGPEAAAALGSITITGNGNFIAVTGTLNDDGTFFGSGSGEAAGVSGVSVTLQGTITRNASGVITGYTATYTVGAAGELYGTPVSYSVSAGG